MIITYFSILDDAYFFLNQAKGRADVPSVTPLIQRYIRASILSSWIAVEEVLNHTIEDLRKRNVDHPAMLEDQGLRTRIEAIFEMRGAKVIDRALFAETRAMRNALVHPRTNASEETLMTIEQAANVFDFCYTLIRLVCPYSVTLSPIQSLVDGVVRQGFFLRTSAIWYNSA